MTTEKGCLASTSQTGLSVFEESVRNTPGNQAGTRPYIAPEVVLEGSTGFPSDIWSFALTVARVLGYWCEAELIATTAERAAKLAARGVVNNASYTEPDQFDGSQLAVLQRWYSRVMFMAQAVAILSIASRGQRLNGYVRLQAF